MYSISVVIPFYNCEKHIEQCIQSVQAQSLQNLEILCVDDGSEDHSAEIVEMLGEKDSRIKIWKQENRGAGAARNFAMQKATGKYIIFLDADDYWIESSAIEQMFNCCEKNQIGACGSRMKLVTGAREEALNFYGMNTNEIQGNKKYSYLDYQFDFGFTSFLFLREILITNKIFFPPFRRFQDPPFLVSALFKINEFMIAECELYCYRASNIGRKMHTVGVVDLAKGLAFNLNFAKLHSLNRLFEKTVNHIEYEQTRVLLQNMNIKIIEILLDINHVICDYYKDNTYVIRPLSMLFQKVREDSIHYESNLLALVKNEEKIIIFGAGIYAKSFISFLDKNGMKHKIRCVVVSDVANNPDQLEGIAVIGLNCATLMADIKILKVFVAAGSQYHREIEGRLNENELINIELIDVLFLYEISR